jgi:hypothetical protein
MTRDPAAENKRLSMKINRLLPDDPNEAISAIALCHANVVVATGCDDERAIQAFRIALRQMRTGMPKKH